MQAVAKFPRVNVSKFVVITAALINEMSLPVSAASFRSKPSKNIKIELTSAVRCKCKKLTLTTIDLSFFSKIGLYGAVQKWNAVAIARSGKTEEMYVAVKTFTTLSSTDSELKKEKNAMLNLKNPEALKGVQQLLGFGKFKKLYI